MLADHHGNVVHLHERDCSTQRRHQKVLEEAPAPTISDAVRRLVTDSAVALAREVGYTNAGTVEFLLDTATDEAYFLEMNTRLQVEHPVTEAVTGLDLVHLQLDVAAGEPLPFKQDDITVTGHAIEARVYAEDSFGGFLPQAGTADLVRWPDGGGIRVDQALESGQVVSTAYDPMLGKVIAHGPDRETARRALVEALDATGDPRADHQHRVPARAGRERRVPARDHRHRLARPPRGAAARARGAAGLRGLGPGDAGRGAGHRAPVPGRRLPARRYAGPDGRRARRDRARRPRGRHRRRASRSRSSSAENHVAVLSVDGRREVAVVNVQPHTAEVAYHGQRFVFEQPDVFADHGAGRRRRLGARADARHRARRPGRGRSGRRRGRRARRGRGDEDGAGAQGAVRRHGRRGRRGGRRAGARWATSCSWSRRRSPDGAPSRRTPGRACPSASRSTRSAPATACRTKPRSSRPRSRPS